MERAAHRIGQLGPAEVGVVGGPGPAGHGVTSPAVGDELVGEPLAAGLEVPLEEGSGDGGQLREEAIVGAHPDTLPTGR